MTERRRILLVSSAIMAIVAVSAAVILIPLLYHVAFEEQRTRLQQMAQCRARIIRTFGDCGSDSRDRARPGQAEAALARIIETSASFEGFGETGEFTVAKRDGDSIVWLFSHRHWESDTPAATPFDSELAEPMRRALSGTSGTLVGLDYRGIRVLAAHEPLAQLGWAVVAKIDIAEIRSPFVRAGALAGGAAFLVFVIGVALMLRVASPLVRRIETRVERRTADLFAANKQLRDEIRQRKELEGELRRLSNVFRDATAPMIIQSQSSRIIDVNPEVTRSYGWSREELLGQPIDKIVPPQYHEQQRELMRRCLAGYSVRHVESARQGKSGRPIPVLLTMSLLCDEEGKPFGVASIAKDLSEQKGLEHQLRDAAIDAALAEDKERRKLAVDLHDGLGQLLTVMGIKLGLLRDSTEQPQLASRVREIERVLKEVDERVSSLSFQLSPPILHDMGLVAAVEWLAEEFQNRFGVRVAVEDDGTRQVLDEATRVTLFRGLRELLLNVTKHAQVGAAHVRLWREDRVVKLEVRDEGIGFNPDRYEGGYGLFSLRKRLNRLGGSMEIESVPGDGTTTVLTAPITSSITEGTQGEA